ncbi:unnamed protein product [Lymnaea stagnalis]|uniref:Uncharacterized protein n=1 Tax=Lymnaea stagnalis TaxID=6523 RepID=A0AAV2IHD5_LYMST
MDGEEMGAVVGGCIVGGVVLFFLVAIIIVVMCGKSKQRNRKEISHFRPLQQGVSPSHSQPSTLGQDGRLPKVNSTGLWLGAPSMYSAAPSEAYYHGYHTTPRSTNINTEVPLHLQRATSELRIPVTRKPFVPPRPAYSSQNNVYIIPYQHPQQIYRSQPLAPVYEGHPARGMAIYDAYPFLGNANGGPPRSKLLETKHSPYFYADNFRIGSKLDHSHSDAHHSHSDGHRSQRSDQKLLHSTNTSSASSQDKRSQHSLHDSSVYLKVQPNNDRRISVGRSEIARESDRGQRAGPAPDVHGSYDNRGYSPESGHGHNSQSFSNVSSNTHLPNGTLGMVSAYVSKPGPNGVPASATDSMKILAKNKTDDQKTHPPFSEASEDSKLAEAGSDVRHQKYNYIGGLHSNPVEVASETDPNPHITRMKAMVIEKTRYNNPIIEDAAQLNDRHEVYSGVAKLTRVTRSEVTETVPDADIVNGILDGLVLPDSSGDKPALQSPLGASSDRGHSTHFEKEHSAKMSTSHTSNDNDKKEKVEGILTKNVHEYDGATEYVTNAGKITDSAFQFLDNYLSEDEGTDTPPLSPGVHREVLKLFVTKAHSSTFK